MLADVANGLNRRGHFVSVLTFEETGGTSFYHLDDSIDRINIGVGSTTRPAGPIETITRVRALRSSVMAARPDVVIGFMHSMFVPLGLALLRTGVPIIGSEHIVPEHYRTRPIESLLLRATPAFITSLTCVSQQVTNLYPRQLAKIMHIIPNPVAVEVGRYADPRGGTGQPKVLLTVGRLSAQKDHITLIEAFHAIAPKVPDWSLRIVGEGELHQHLQARISELKLSGKVELAGSSRDVSAEYAKGQLFVMPSLYESFGLTVIEASAHGLPVVAFADCVGVNQLVRPGYNGVLVKASGSRVAALASGLLRVMQDDDLRVRLGQAAIALPAEHNLQAVLDSWDNLAYACLE